MISELFDIAKDCKERQLIDIKENSTPKVAKPQEYDINEVMTDLWARVSHKYAQDYEHGREIAGFGSNTTNIKTFLARICTPFKFAISNEHQKEGIDAAYLSKHMAILENIIQLISQDIEKKNLEKFDIYSIIATLQGFLLNYFKIGKQHNEEKD